MKDSEEYRKQILQKVQQEPVHLDSDEDLFEKVWDRFSEKKQEKKRRYLYAAAAVIAMAIGVVSVFTLTNPSVETLSEKGRPEKQQPLVNNEKPVPAISSENENSETAKRATENSIPSSPAPVRWKREASLSTQGKTMAHHLAEGSDVFLNSSSAITVERSATDDYICNLEGEGYFEVKSGLKRTFRVNFGDAYLIVVGTKFNVRNIKGEPYKEVAVLEGIVKVYASKDGRPMEVRSGDLIKIGKDKGEHSVSDIDPEHYIAWKTGQLKFKKTNLQEVALLLQRVYNIHFTMDSSVRNCTFTGDLSQMPLEEALQVIQVTSSFKINRTKDNVHISGESCK